MKHSHDCERALITAVNHSGDSDSTGTIAGNILGVFLGTKGIPKKYLTNLELADIISRVDTDLWEQ